MSNIIIEKVYFREDLASGYIEYRSKTSNEDLSCVSWFTMYDDKKGTIAFDRIWDKNIYDFICKFLNYHRNPKILKPVTDIGYGIRYLFDSRNF